MPSSRKRGELGVLDADPAEHVLRVGADGPARAAADPAGRPRELGHDAGHGHLAVDLVLVRDEQPALAEPRVVVDVLRRVDGRAHDAGLVDDLVELGRRVLGGERADDLVEQVLVLAAGVVRREPRVVGVVRVAHDLREPLPERVVVRRDDDPLAVLRPVDVRRRDPRQPRPRRLSDVPRLLVLHDGRLHHREAGVGDRGVDHLALRAARVAGVEREQDALERRLRGERVPQRDAGPRRRLVRIAVDVAQAGDRLASGREARALAVAAGLPVARDPRVDRAGVHRVHVLGAEPPALHRAGPEVLEHHVCGRHEPLRDLLAALLAQVERHRRLVAGEDRPPQRVVVVAQAAPVAHRVARAGRLDLHHVGPEVAEQRPHVGTREELPELQDAQAAERPVLKRHGSPP